MVVPLLMRELDSFLSSQALRGVEVNLGDRRTRRAAGKSDTIDAEVAARSVLAGQSTAIPKTADGAVEMMRQLKITRDTAVKARTMAMHTLKQIIVHAPPVLREALHDLTDHGLLTRGAGLRPGPIDTPTASAKHTLRALARRWMALTEEIAIHDQHLARLTTETSPTLREGFGVGGRPTTRRCPGAGSLSTSHSDAFPGAPPCTSSSTALAGRWSARVSGRRGWKKLHLGVDQAGVIVAQALTDAAVDDASTGIDLIETIASSARTVTADAAYDTLAFYETANTRGTTVVVPPAKTAKLSRRNPRSSARDGTISRISKIGRRRWKKEVGYHRQARVENAFFRYKSMLGDRLRSRTRAAQAVESVLACNVLNRMTELGRPESFAIDRWTNLRVGALGASFDLRNNAGSRPALVR